jgi:hypothetical protein
MRRANSATVSSVGSALLSCSAGIAHNDAMKQALRVLGKDSFARP